MLGNSREDLGIVIRDRRKSMGLSMHELSEKSGVSYGALQSIEAGKSNPRNDTIEALLNALGLSPSDLYGLPSPSAALSVTVVTGPLTASDCAAILLRISEVSPERRAVVLGILFDDASLVPTTMTDVARLLSTIG